MSSPDLIRSREKSRRKYLSLKRRRPEILRLRAFKRRMRFRIENPERYKELKRLAFRRYYAKNSAKINAKAKARRAAIPKTRKLLTQEERKRARRVERLARKAREKGNGGRPSRNIKERLFLAQKGRCVYCRELMTEQHIDHILPLALGGSSDDSNLQLLCPDCNNRKGAYHPVEFANKLGMLL